MVLVVGRVELAEAKRQWGLYVVLGALLVAIGVVALGSPVAISMLSVLFFGWMLVLTGLAQAVVAFQVRRWQGFLVHLLAAILEIVVGLLVIRTPAEMAAMATLLIAAFLLVGGLFRLILAIRMGFPYSGLMALGGLVSALLGLALVIQWPASGLWFLGTVVGIDLILHGTAWIGFALAVRRIELPGEPPAT